VRRVAAIALLAMIAVSEALSAELTPFLESRRLGIAVSALPLPEKLPRELTSGLTNRLLVRVTLLADSRTVAQRAVEIAVKYDLWDENFSVTTRIDGAVVQERNYGNVAEVLGMLTNLRLAGLFGATELAAESPLVVRADALLNPIDRERLEQIRKWVAENTTPAPPTRGTSGASAPSANAASNAIFNRIFEQYAGGAGLAAAWNQNLSSRPFRPEDLARDGQ
jgi:hypothetical protein